MIWATVSSQSCFCWLYRASSSLTAKNIINLISVLAIWWCLHVEFSLVLLEDDVCAMTSAFSWQNSISLCPASFCTPRPNLPMTSDISWLPPFVFQFPMRKRTSYFGVSCRRSCRWSQNHSTSALSITGWIRFSSDQGKSWCCYNRIVFRTQGIQVCQVWHFIWESFCPL